MDALVQQMVLAVVSAAAVYFFAKSQQRDDNHARDLATDASHAEKMSALDRRIETLELTQTTTPAQVLTNAANIETLRQEQTGMAVAFARMEQKLESVLAELMREREKHEAREAMARMEPVSQVDTFFNTLRLMREMGFNLVPANAH
ncbi:MAG: hypothetical protein AB7O04_07370 [Hyphomonadaceae bacterium]